MFRTDRTSLMVGAVTLNLKLLISHCTPKGASDLGQRKHISRCHHKKGNSNYGARR